jgi:predicted TIM-barrel fold metal-dependent hydrolase
MSDTSSSPEVILEPELPIIDPHHHLWDRGRGLLGKLQPMDHGFMDVLQQIPRYLLDELLADLKSGHNIRSTVYMECGAMYRADGPEALRCIGETEFVNGVAAMTASGLYGDVRACVGIVSSTDLRLGSAVEEPLRAHIAAAPARFRGIRQRAAHDDDPDVLGPLHGRVPPGIYCDTKFREGFKLLRKLELSFDAWILEPQLPDLIDLASAFPDTVIVLDHVGTPLGVGRYRGKREERFGIWRDNIKALSRCENVFVKLGGLPMPFLGWRKRMSEPLPSSEVLARDWKPYIETCIQDFGPKRCMFESNFPVDRFGCDYVALWNAFKRLAAGCSADEKTELFSGTAARVYRIDRVH